jgi:hypothetical protein
MEVKTQIFYWLGIAMVLIKQLVSAYHEAIIRFVVVVVGDRGPEPKLWLHCSHEAYCTPCFLEVPTVAARCLHVLRDMRDPSSERWNFSG